MTTYIIEEESVEDYLRRLREEDSMLREALGLNKPEGKEMDYFEIVRKLIGPVQPRGESDIDSKRLINLIEFMGLLDKMVREVTEVARNSNRHEASMKEMGQYAKAGLENIRRDLAEIDW